MIKTIKLCEVNTQRCLATFQDHSNNAMCVAALDADRIMSGSDDKTLKLCKVNTQRCLATFKGRSGHVICVAVLAQDPT